jgi:hypothetical protein
MSRLLRRPGHLLCRQHEGRGPHLSADLHRYLRTTTKEVVDVLYAVEYYYSTKLPKLITPLNRGQSSLEAPA